MKVHRTKTTQSQSKKKTVVFKESLVQCGREEVIRLILIIFPLLVSVALPVITVSCCLDSALCNVGTAAGRECSSPLQWQAVFSSPPLLCYLLCDNSPVCIYRLTRRIYFLKDKRIPLSTWQLCFHLLLSLGWMERVGAHRPQSY